MSSKTPAKGGGAGGGEQEPRFEDAMAELESIIERIESGEVDLDRALREHERGVALLRRCREMLARAEQRIQELSAGGRDAAG